MITPEFTIYGPSGYKLEFPKPAVMAIINATPDSFSDGGDVDSALKLEARINEVIEQGADIIDVGGESTRPGFEKISAETEISRAVPVIKAIRAMNRDLPISVDTTKFSVALAALEAGATFINDISSLSDKKMASLIAETNCSVVLMRNKALAQPIIESCSLQMQGLISTAVQTGINHEKIILDPGLGFGDFENQDFKALPGGNVDANLNLIVSIGEYSQGIPVLIGGSRKRFVGEMTGVVDAKKRLAGSLAVAYLAFTHGAAIVRAHDISQTVQLRDIVISNI